MSEGAEVYFFGCKKGIGGINRAGHYFYATNGERDWLGEKTLPYPLPFSVDGGFCPERGKATPYGAARLTHWSGWTGLGIWDSSGDTRPGSDSNFFCEGTLDFEEMLEAARTAWPKVVARIEVRYGPITLRETIPIGDGQAHLERVEKHMKTICDREPRPWPTTEGSMRNLRRQASVEVVAAYKKLAEQRADEAGAR